jgi:hypothetical protein
LVLDAAAAGVATAANAQVRTDMAPRILNGQPMPEPNSDQSAGLVSDPFSYPTQTAWPAVAV